MHALLADAVMNVRIGAGVLFLLAVVLIVVRRKKMASKRKRIP